MKIKNKIIDFKNRLLKKMGNKTNNIWENSKMKMKNENKWKNRMNQIIFDKIVQQIVWYLEKTRLKIYKIHMQMHTYNICIICCMWISIYQVS